jgi:alpha-tubulin suppressor-like RCC1 family protein
VWLNGYVKGKQNVMKWMVGLVVKKSRVVGIGCLVFGLLLSAIFGLVHLNSDSLAWHATGITPSSGPSDGDTETIITGDFELGTIKVVKIQVMSGEAVAALDNQGQVYTWGESIEPLGYGRQNAGGVCYHYINFINYHVDPNYTNETDCWAAGSDYAWEETEEFYTPRNINQLAGGDIGPDTVIIDILVTENNFFALDDQGQVYVWGQENDGAGLGLAKTCDYTNYDNQVDCENADGYWGDELYAPVSINRVAAGDIGPSTRITKLYVGGEDAEWTTIYAIDDQGQLYAWGGGNIGNGQYADWYHAPVNINQVGVGDITLSTVIVDIAIGEDVTYAVDDQGQVYVWGSEDFNGLGVIYICSDSQYLTEAECVANGEYWYDDLRPVDIYAPTNLSLVAAGAITPAVKIVDVVVGDGVGYAIDDQGQLYAWSGVYDDYDYRTGLGVSWFCDRYPYYTNQADCEAAGYFWNQDFSPTYNAPVNVSQTAAGSIKPGTVVKSITTTSESVFVLDADGQLHVWGSSYYALALGEDYYYEYCSWAEGDDQATCENNGGYWEESYDIPIPVSVNQTAAGDITATTRIVSLNAIANEGYAQQYFAIDDNGQVYAWGLNEDGGMGLGNVCSNPDGNGSQYWCELEGGTWDAAKDQSEFFAPVNINQFSGSVIGDDVAIVALYGGGGEGYNTFAIDSNGNVYAWGSYKEFFGASPCSIEVIFDDQSQCLSSGGTWDQSKALIEQDYSALLIDQFSSGEPSSIGGSEYQVFFDGVASPNVTVIDEHTLLAITPPHVAGVVDVAVIDGATMSVLYKAYEYTEVYVKPPGQPFVPNVPSVPNTGIY